MDDISSSFTSVTFFLTSSAFYCALYISSYGWSDFSLNDDGFTGFLYWIKLVRSLDCIFIRHMYIAITQLQAVKPLVLLSDKVEKFHISKNVGALNLCVVVAYL